MKTITIILIVLFAFVSIFFGVILIKKALNAKETTPAGIIDTGTEETSVAATSTVEETGAETTTGTLS